MQVKHVSLKKRKNREESFILEGISLEISPEQVTLILGKSGSGKTSLLRCLCLLEKEFTGQVLYQGRDLRTLPRKDRCQTVGFVPQSYALFPFMNVLQNCMHPLRVHFFLSESEAKERTLETLSSLDMQEYLYSYPHEISGGQRQRVAIVRSLMLKPSFLLLDEPTSALDPLNTSLLIQTIEQLKQEGIGVIISSQDMLFAERLLDRVYFLEQGRLVEEHLSIEEPAIVCESTKLYHFLKGL